MRDAPVPMAHLTDSSGDGARALRIAIGVVSICVATLGALSGLVLAIVWVDELDTLSDNAALVAPGTPALPRATTQPALTDPAAVAAVVDGLERVSPLSDADRQRLLDALPRTGVPFLRAGSDGTVKPEAVAESVTGVWITPPNRPDGPYVEYALEGGTIDLTVDGVAVYDYRELPGKPWASATVAGDGAVEFHEGGDYLYDDFGEFSAPTPRPAAAGRWRGCWWSSPASRCAACWCWAAFWRSSPRGRPSGCCAAGRSCNCCTWRGR